MEARLHAALADGALVLTATRRLARTLVRAYDRHQASTAHAVWCPPDVLPFRAWLDRAWHATCPERVLLTPLQAQTSWERVIAEDLAATPTPLRPDAAAPLALEANDLVHGHQLPEPSPPELTDEYRAFRRWRAAFAARCHAHTWLDPAELPAAVTAAFAAARLPAPARVILAGFDRLRPAEKTLLAALRAAGTVVETWAPATAHGAIRRVHGTDPLDEARLAATWTRHGWDPHRRTAIVVPDLGLRRGALVETFRAELAPASVVPGTPLPPVLNVSLGAPLADEPLVAAALALLRILLAPVTWADAIALVASPFVGEAASEWRERARLELALRRAGRPEIDCADLASRAAAAGATRTAARLGALADAAIMLGPLRLGAADWARRLDETLLRAGWPGERTLDGREAQALEAWHAVLGSLASLDLPLAALPLTDAVGRLTILARRRIFQPESPEAPLQVLGLLETAGLRFDRLWLMGLHADALPRRAAPNPLIPPALQRRHGLPRSSPEHELAVARTFFHRLTHAAGEVVVSAPRTLDGQPTEASALVGSLPVSAPWWPLETQALAAAVHRTAALERVRDRPPPPLTASEPRAFSAAVLRDQSACPFRAFARHRLGVRALEQPSEDLTPAEWGEIVHVALERVWEALGSSERLVALPEPALAGLVAAACDSALAPVRKLRAGLREIAQTRLATLVLEWLALEKARGTGFVVIAREQPVEIAIGALRLRARLDRIDRLEGERHVLLDYKTGRASCGDWDGPRPAAPQLPLYARLESGLLPRVDAVAFAQLGPRPRFAGIAAAEDLLPEVGPPAGEADAAGAYAGLLARWAATLEALAADFAAGRSEIDPAPTHRPRACAHCDLPALCRIGERETERAVAR